MTTSKALPTNVRMAEYPWASPPPAKLVVEDEEALRSALAEYLAALDDARIAELAIAGRVNVAAREQSAAEQRHAAAVDKTAAARREAADAMQAWLASHDTDRPGSEALSAALSLESAAKIDAEVVEAALAGLKSEHEAAIAETKRVLCEAELTRDRIVLAQACQMAAELIEVDERALELRRTLSELLRALPVNVILPGGIREAMTPKHIPFEVSGHSPGVRRWSKFRNDLLADAQVTVGPLGD